MENLFVPKDYSSVSETVPEGDDVLYSTLCKVIKVESHTISTIKMHAVITQSGIGFCPMNKEENKPFLPFLKWDGITGVKSSFGKTVLKWGWSDRKRIRIRVIMDPEFESNESFLVRKRKFTKFCKDVWSKKVAKD